MTATSRRPRRASPDVPARQFSGVRSTFQESAPSACMAPVEIAELLSTRHSPDDLTGIMGEPLTGRG